MITFKTTYQFKNGVTCDFTICNDKKNPLVTVDWSCDKKHIKELRDEYVSECVPFVYQQIADYTKQPITWIDQKTLQIQHFKPSVSSLN